MFRALHMAGSGTGRPPPRGWSPGTAQQGHGVEHVDQRPARRPTPRNDSVAILDVLEKPFSFQADTAVLLPEVTSAKTLRFCTPAMTSVQL